MSITSEGMGLTNTIQGISPLKINDRGIGKVKTGASGESAFSSVFRTALETAQSAMSGAEKTDDDNFIVSIFKDAIQNVKETDAQFVNDQYLLATGQLENPAEIGISAYKNEIAVDLLIQLRNKALDVYNQLTSMSV